MDMDSLAKELSLIRAELRKVTDDPEADIAAGEIGLAEIEAKNGNSAGVLGHLKNAGKWALNVGEKIGVPVTVEFLKKILGV